MAVTTPCYSSREDVKRATDIQITARNNSLVDDAIQSAARDIENFLNRVFYPTDATRKFDWPNYSYAFPWRLWLDANELAAQATTVTAGGVALTLANLFFEPVNYGPPYSSIQINRSTNTSFGGGSTPQQSVAVTGTFGYDLNFDPAGTLAAVISSTSATTITVSDSSAAEVGHLLLVDSERMLVSDRTMTQVGTLTVSGSGVNTASNSDVTLAVSGSGTLLVGETILIDAERMLVVDVSGSNYVVKRGYDGTVLATHSAGATINAPRLLTVVRGVLGTTAATHSNSAPVSRFRVPALVKELAIAEAVNTVQQKTSAYSRTIGEGDTLQPVSGAGLADIRKRTQRAYGRKARQRVI